MLSGVLVKSVYCLTLHSGREGLSRMIKSKNIAFSLFVILLSLILVVGCGGQSPATNDAQSTQSGSDTSATSGNDTQSTSQPASGQFHNIRIGTAQLGGGSHSYGMAVATIVNPLVPSIKLEAMPSSGVVENIRSLEAGEIEIGVVTNDLGYDFYKGRGRYEGKPFPDLRLMWPIFVSHQHIIVKADSPIMTIEDLKGKDVGVGNPGSAGYYLITHLLRAHGLQEGDYREHPLTHQEQVAALRDGKLDSFGVYTSSNSPAIVELATTTDVRWLAPDIEKWRSYISEHDLPYGVAPIKGGMYRGLDEDLPTASLAANFVTTKDFPEDLAYEITKAFFENIEDAAQIFATIAESPEALSTEIPFAPWHPGVERYFKEAGIPYVPFQE